MHSLKHRQIERFADGGNWGGEVQGFTLIELMVVISIMAILAALAAPSFQSIMERWRVRQTAEALQSTLFLARSEAIKHGGRVVIDKNPQNTDGCQNAGSNGSWGCGWLVSGPSGEQIQWVPPPHEVTVSVTPAEASLRLDRYGTTGTSNVSFLVQPAHAAADVTSAAALRLCLSPGGRLSMIKGKESC